MEQQHGTDQPTSNLSITGIILLGGAVTFNVVVHILLRWKSYDWLGKSMSVVLLANLAALLVGAFLHKKGKRKLQPDTLLLVSYLCLMLMTSVFNYH